MTGAQCQVRHVSQHELSQTITSFTNPSLPPTPKMSFSANIKAAGTRNHIILPPHVREVVKQSIAQLQDNVDELEEEIARLRAIRRGKPAKLEELRTAISPRRRLDIILSPDIRDVVKQSIAHVEENLDELREDISRLLAIRRVKVAELEELHTAISPQRRLPTEVLCLIFEHAHLVQAPERKFLSCPHDLKPNLSPWNLRQVCSHWRRVALSCHSLWDAVSVEWQDIVASAQRPYIPISTFDPLDPGPSFSCWTRRLTNAREILPTSGNVHIHVSTVARDWEVDDILRNAFVILVQPFLGRLQTLSYEFPDVLFPLFRQLHQTPFDQIGPLESIALRVHPKPFGQCYTHEHLRLGSLAQLRHLDIQGDNNWLLFLFRHKIPWSNLITFKISSKDLYREAWMSMPLVLAQCNNLKHLEIESGRYRRDDSNPATPTKDRICLPQLETLRISSSTPTPLKSIITPSLVSLVLVCPTLPMDLVIQFLEDSKCQLQIFKEEQPSISQAPGPVHRRQFLQMMGFMKTVKTFETSIVLGADEITLMVKKLVPDVERLVFSTQEPLEVLSIIKACFEASSSSADFQLREIAVEVVKISRRTKRRMNALVRDLKIKYGIVVEVGFFEMDWSSRRHLIEP